MTYARCRRCHGYIEITGNRCIDCGRLDSVWTAIAAAFKRWATT